MKEFVQALRVLVTLTILTGLVYPFVMTGLGQLFFPRQASGSLTLVDGKVIGSALIGQNFSSQKYFIGRPSALEKAYDAGNSGGSNFGPSNAKFLGEVNERVKKVRIENYLGSAALIPADLVLASGSGLDPDITLDSALLQVRRVAKARGLDESRVRKVLEATAQNPFLGFVGEKRVNVLRLNLALDRTATRSAK